MLDKRNKKKHSNQLPLMGHTNRIVPLESLPGAELVSSTFEIEPNVVTHVDLSNMDVYFVVE